MREPGLTPLQRAAKRALDLTIAVPALIMTAPIIAVAVAIASVDTRQWGIFAQRRIGRGGRPFILYKIRTMRSNPATTTTSTSRNDPRITHTGRVLRRFKIDELPQLVNVLKGDMSLVGPRPDVDGFANCLQGADRIILSVRPGITGPATLAFRSEEEILAEVDDPETYNLQVIWPAKVQINCRYVEKYSLLQDILTMTATLIGRPFSIESNASEIGAAAAARKTIEAD